MQKLLFINCSSKISGAEISLLELVHKLNKDLFSVHIILPKKNDLVPYLPSNIHPIFLPISRKRFKDIIRISEWINLLLYSWAIIRLVKKLDIDIVYCNTSKALLYCFLIKFTSVKIICHCRDVEKSSLMKGFINMVSDQIIYVSNFIYQQVKFPSSKTVVCSNGIDTNKFNLASKRLSDKPFTIANIGQATQWKRQDFFVDIAASIVSKTSKVHFVLVIYEMEEEDSDYISKIRKKISRLGLDNHFTIIGFQKDIAHLLSTVDLLIHTSIHEPFGRVVAESLAMGIPVIAPAEGGYTDLIIDNQTGFLIADADAKIFAEKAIYLINNQSIRTRFGVQGRRIVEEKCNSSVQTRKIEMILNSV